MMRRVRSAALIMVFLSPAVTAAPKPTPPKPIDIAEFLRRLDAELTAFDAASPVLHRALAASSGRTAKANGARSWQQPAASLQLHARNIRAIAHGYRLSSGNMKNTSAGQIFSGLETASVRVAQTAHQLQLTRQQSSAKQLEGRLDSETVALVRRVETLVAGFPALKCGDREAPCCASHPIHEGKDTFQGCHWICVKETRNCKSGLCGQSATAAPK